MPRFKMTSASVALLAFAFVGVAVHAAQQSNLQEERVQRPGAGNAAGAAGAGANVTLGQEQIPAAGNARIPVLIELAQEPGALTFAGVLERAGTRTPQTIAAAASAAQAQIARIEGEQQAVAAALANPAIGADEMFRVRRAMNGIAATVNGDSIAAIRRIPGVKTVHVLELEYPTNSTSVPFLGTVPVWGNTLGLGLPITGAGIRLGVIDTGVDYQHATFGGTGLLADYQANNRTVAPDTFFPSAKVTGGWDFAGDSYNGGNAAVPDADPMDCNGHGTHVAGTAAGYGVTAAGATFTGPYDASIPFGSLRIGPGSAPQASVYALRIFGCTGGTNLTVQAIDWAMDPNNDNDLSDRLDVINMSLGSNFGSLASATAIASDNAAAAGVIVVTSAGNSGDTYFISGSPGAASRVISTAASIDEGQPDTLASFSSRGPRGGGGSRTTLKPDVAAPGYQILSAQTGVTCTSGSCMTPNGSGYLPNSATLTLNGTSMAAPHVAGVMALLRQLHPSWTVEELKALVMNSALHDVTTLAAGGDRYGPGRIGAGRVDATLAAQAPVVAFNADESGQVSLSFDGDVQGSITRVKHLRLVNHGSTAQTYDLAIDTVVDAPGVSFSLPGGSSVTLAAGESTELTVQMSADASQMEHTKDASASATQTAPSSPASIAGLGAQPRHWLTEEAGYLVLSQAGTPRLRVPVYTAPLSHSSMKANGTIATGGVPTGSTTLPLTGTGLCTGTLAGASCTTSGPEDVASIVNPFELQIVSPANPNFAFPEEDIRHVGVAYESGADRLLFGVSTYGAWKTPNDVTFNIYVDCGVYTNGANFNADTCNGVPDGSWDLILFNTNPGSLAQLFGNSNASPQDSFITAVFVRTRSSVVFGPVEYLNRASSAIVDTRAFDNNVMMLPVDRTRLKVSAVTGTFQYFVYTCPGFAGLCQVVNGYHYDETNTVTWNYLAQGLSFGGSTLYHDQPGATLPVTWNTANLTANGSLGALLLHHHNAPGQRAEVVLLDTNTATDLGITMTASTTTPAQGQDVTLTMTVTNHGAQPASSIQVYAEIPTSLQFASSSGDGAYDDALGLWTIAGPLAPGGSATRQVVVTATSTEALSARATIGTPIDGNSSNNQATLGLSSAPQADVQITAIGSGPTLAGTPGTVTVTLTNAGQDPAYGIVVSHAITAGAGAIQSGTPTAGSFNPATGQWTIASLNSGGSASLTLSALAQGGPLLTVQAQAGASVSDPNLANNTSAASLPVIVRSTSTTTLVTPATVPVGQPGTIQITVADTEATGTKSAPTGTVSISTPISGASLSATSCALSAISATASSCSVTLTPAIALAHSIATTYGGSIAHGSSVGNLASLGVDKLPTTTTTSNMTAAPSNVAQTLVFTANVTNSSRTVNEGTVTFSVVTDTLTPLGTPAVATVTNGTATANWELPAGTPPQTLHISAAYVGGSVFLNSSDVTKMLTITVPTLTYMLGEGATGDFFDTQILLANPNQQEAPVTLRFLKKDGSTIEQPRTLAPMSRTTIEVDTLAGLEGTEVSTVVISDSGLPLAVERTMFWDATGYGSHTEKAVPGPMTDWYFAEGSQGWFSTYLLLGNPGGTANVAHVTYFLEGAAPVQRDYPMAPTSRRTIDAGQEPELVNQSFGMRVTFDQPGIAERSMYFSTNALWAGGHGAAGVTAPSTSWFLAEGATGSFFTTYLLVANPNAGPANLTITYLRDAGEPITKTHTLAGGRRFTQNIADADPELVATSVGVRVTSDVPVVVERAQYWPQPEWAEAHASAGVTETGTRWGLAEGRVGGEREYQTYILLANPGTEQATVDITFLRTTGAPVLKQFTIAPGRRINVSVFGANSLVPELSNESFGTLIESTQPIVVERSLYGTIGGVIWATGTNATGTRLP